MSKSDLIDVSVQLHHETPKAWLVSDDGVADHGVWIPKTQAEMEPSKTSGVYTLTLPEWLATDKRLI